MYDPLGRQFQSVLSSDEVANDGSGEISHVERSYFTGEAADPVAQVALGGDGIGARWTLRGAAGVVGEVRDDQSRYLISDQLGSPRMVLDADSSARLQATYDYDTFGAKYELDNDLSLASGTPTEYEATTLGYTGMPTRTTTQTTNHHARDYDPTLRQWLQTDQYTDPWADLGLSLDPSTRDRVAYVGGNPVGLVDVDGHRTTWCKPKDPCAKEQAEANVATWAPVGTAANVASTVGGGASTVNSNTTTYLDPSTATLVDAYKEGSSVWFYSFSNYLYEFNAAHPRAARAASVTSDVAVGDQVSCGNDLGFNTTCVLALLTLWKPAKAAEYANDARRGVKAIDHARDAKRATRGASRDGGFCSFSEGTGVLMADGSTKPIQYVQVGDWVMAATEASGQDPQPRRVTHVWKHEDDFVYLYTSSGRIVTTDDHPFFDHTAKRYRAAGELPWGAQLQSPDGEAIYATGTSPTGPGTAYNLTVDDRHTYYVSAGTGSVLVHNTRTCRFKPDPDAVGEHSVFRNGTDGRINGYQTYEYGYGGRLLPTKRFRGTGQDHGGFNPPYVMDPRSPGARPSVPREPFPWELPFGY